MDGLRGYEAVSVELSRRFAASLGLHSTDASALLAILDAEERGESLSPARLSERIGLTSGATSSLLNRLEEAGHIERSRVHSDRRVVTLHSTPDVQKIAGAFFEPLQGHVDAMMNAYPDELLQQFEAFLGDLRSTMDAYMQDLSAADRV
ncbi:MarR family winged helix-turn-helix transcriptional regulator [Leifsonia sp. A12D58]|uniref:MarR family winged helix-turn-helix transcriptional regulator n=1 Tax=Leifsonia sp. A12D58 TaxID=3397674 RepID=UPI0039E0B378